MQPADNYSKIEKSEGISKPLSYFSIEKFEKKMGNSSMPSVEKVHNQLRNSHGHQLVINEKTIPTVSSDKIKNLISSTDNEFKKNDSSDRLIIINLKSDQDKLKKEFNFTEMFFKVDNPKKHQRNDKLVYEFDQGENLIIKLDENDHKTLNNVMNRFGGLCELVCNHVLKEDLLGRENEQPNFLIDNINLNHLNKKEIKNSHMADNVSIFTKILAFFGYYTTNFFSHETQKKMVTTDRKLNREGIRKTLEDTKKFPVGGYLKVDIFWKEGLNFGGHALLIKKVGEDASGKGIYSFFDPGQGDLPS